MTDEEDSFFEGTGIDRKEGEDSRAILVGVYKDTSGKEICEEYLRELESLADTFGVPTVTKFSTRLRSIDASTYIHQGKLVELSEEIKRSNANLVIFDEEISPAQQRNLEKELKLPIMDRTELILEIFAQRAHTKEARLQIELARTKYQFPRLKRLWSHFSRQRAKGGYLKGEGEKQIEIDRRLLKKKLEKLNTELEQVKQYRQTQKSARLRSGIPTFAIIGYTNAGKSTLLNALTEANVLVEDKLFATLDPTTRKFLLPNNQAILLTDTVGFIRKLPHTLVSAFKSTLEAALQDDVLIHLVDASHPMAVEQAKTTRDLLQELDVSHPSILTVLNKVDLCADQKTIHQLRILYPKTVVISATKKTGFEELLSLMIKELSERRVKVLLKIPQEHYHLVSEIRRMGHVLKEEYVENDILISAEIPAQYLHRYKEYEYIES